MPSETPLLAIAYAPPIAYFKLLSEGLCTVDACENFQKQSFRNRCRILAPDGIRDLVIPVEQGAASSCPIRDVAISQHNRWQSRHLQAITSSYGTTPFYEYYIDDIASLYERRRFRYLFDFNLSLIETIAHLMHLPITLELSENYEREGTRHKDYRAIIHPKQGDERSFFQPASYHQRFAQDDLLPRGLSIYDLLFNMGPEGILVLKECQIVSRENSNDLKCF